MQASTGGDLLGKLSMPPSRLGGVRCGGAALRNQNCLITTALTGPGAAASMVARTIACTSEVPSGCGRRSPMARSQLAAINAALQIGWEGEPVEVSSLRVPGAK